MQWPQGAQERPQAQNKRPNREHNYNYPPPVEMMGGHYQQQKAYNNEKDN